jgi:uncharacterized protein YbaP (TraB family)
MQGKLLAGVMIATIAGSAAAQSAVDAAKSSPLSASIADVPSAIVDMDAITVTGVQPGPGLWKFHKGDRVLWILGTLSPLPKNITWVSRDVNAAVAASGVVLQSPGLAVTADIGFFGRLSLVPSLFKLRKNPNGTKLQEALPPDLYARWQVLKVKYIGNDRTSEKWRPVFAANELYQAALEKNGLVESGIIGPVLDKAVKAAGIETRPTVLTIKIDDPKETLKEFNASTLNDVECFRKTLDRLETDLAVMKTRANAWAGGDIDALRALPYDDQSLACQSSLTDSGFTQKLGIENIQSKMASRWYQVVDDALQEHKVVFATVQISQLLKPGGLVAKLQAKGYEVESP